MSLTSEVTRGQRSAFRGPLVVSDWSYITGRVGWEQVFVCKVWEG